jgi:hypothetical protein
VLLGTVKESTLARASVRGAVAAVLLPLAALALRGRAIQVVTVMEILRTLPVAVAAQVAQVPTELNPPM